MAATIQRQPATVGQHRMPSPDGLTAAPGEYARWDDYMADIEAAQLAWRDQEAVRGMKAMRLASDVTVYQALLAGQPVPSAALDPHWRARYPKR